jgi:DNA mismatch endonuclease (patch repair protein)
MDHISPERRSRNMARIGSRDTGPEMIVRRLLHGLGYQYRLHAKCLPGTPDLIFRSRRTALFVHGCFWHRHPNCRFAFTPKSREDFWNRKFSANVARDAMAALALEGQGWRVLVVWQCETRNMDELTSRLVEVLGPSVRRQLDA